MAFTAGDFTSAALYSEILSKYNRLWQTDGVHNQFKKGTPIFNALARAQTVQFEDADFLDPRLCQSLKINWLQDDETAPSNITLSTQTDFCSFNGAEVGSDSASYTSDSPWEIKFKVVEERCKDQFDFAEKFAFALMSNLHKMDRNLEAKIIAFLQASGDDMTGLDFPTNASLNVDPTILDIAAANVNNTFLAELEIMQEDYYFNKPLWLVGKEMYRLAQKTEAALNPNVSLNDTLLLDSTFVRSLRDMDQIITSPSMFVVDASQLAYFNQYSYTNSSPKDEKVSERIETFHIDSPTAKWTYGGQEHPVKYDVRWYRTCDSTQADTWETRVAIRHQGGFIKAPKGEDSAPTVVQFEQT